MVTKNVTFLFYEITTTPEILAHFPHEAVITNQFLKWGSHNPNALFTAIMSAMSEKISRRTALGKVRKFLTTTNAALVKLGPEQIRTVNTLADAMRKFAKMNHPLDFPFRALFAVQIYGFAFLKGAMYLESSLPRISTAFVHCFYMAVPTAFDVVPYLPA